MPEPSFIEKPNQISPARRVAYDVLLRVELDDAWASDLLDDALQTMRPAEGQSPETVAADRRLAQEIVMGTLRWRGRLDAEIVKVAGRPMVALDAGVRVALRMAFYQIRFLTRIPDSAAVNEAVNLVKADRKITYTAGFVNGVLREAIRLSGASSDVNEPRHLIVRKAVTAKEAAKRKEARKKSLKTKVEVVPVQRTIEDMEFDLSHPAWLLKHWARSFGEERAIKIASANNLPAPVYLWINPLKGEIQTTLNKLDAAGLKLGVVVPDETYELLEGDWAKVWSFVRTGEIYVQDAASQQVARWLGVKPGMRVLDMCASPGGKTAQLAAAMKNDGSITALDLHSHRVEAMKRNLERLGATIGRCFTADAASPNIVSDTDHRQIRKKLPFSLFPDSFDAVLLDAPCSGTGTLRRHPEIKWKLEPRKFGEFAGVQTKLLWNAGKAVKPGGTILYSVCSLEEREGEEVVRTFLKHHRNFEVAPPENAGDAVNAEGFLRLWPEAGPDGFFAARLIRK
jgi:16S rRNA (cytosine967-C5)-methyltransferase